MATVYRRTNPYLGAVSGTARYITVQTNPAVLLSMTSGSQALSIFNHGTGSLIWGGTNVAVNSGNYTFVNMRTEWTNLQDGWSTYLIADSVSTIISVTEYLV